MVGRAVAWCGLVLALAAGCASPQPGASGTERAASGPQQTIVVAAGAPLKGFVAWNQPTTAGGTLGINEISSNGLVSTDLVGNREGRLAAKLPSLEDSSAVILPDGRLRATWPLRPNIKWQDGAPFTAEDVAFGWMVAADPDIPKPSLSGAANILRQMDRVEALDSLTVVVTWKTPFHQHLDLYLRNLWPLPRHLLGDAFEGDKEAFRNLPYFTTDYVHLGPFRLVDFGLGENLVFERFNDYFRGQPRVDRILVRIIQDRNTLFANILSGAIDITVPATLPYELIVDLRTGWARTGAGAVVERPGGSGFRSLITQMNPEYARPVELARDVGVRRGLFFALDRAALAEAMVPGASGVVVNNLVASDDPRAPFVQDHFARYVYDPPRALREFAEAGWQQAGEGRLLNRSGEQLKLVLRSTGGGGSEKEIAIISQFWRQLGMEVEEEILPESLATNLEVRAKFSGFETTSVGGSDPVFTRWDSRIAPTAERRWVGNNRGQYVNPVLDQLVDGVKATLDESEQGRLISQGAEIVARDLPAMPLYRGVDAAVIKKGVRALVDDFVGGDVARNAHLWARE